MRTELLMGKLLVRLKKMNLNKTLIANILLFVFFNIHGQENVTHFSNFLKYRNGYIDKTVPILNSQSNDLSILLIDGKRVYGYLLNEKLKVKDSLNLENKARKYKEIVGKSVFSNNNYTIFLTNKFRDKFATVSFSYESKDSEFNELKLNLANQKFLQTVQYNNSLFIITIEKNTSKLYLYKYDNNLLPDIRIIDFSNESFIDAKEREVSLYQLFIDGISQFSLKEEINLVKIQQDNPNSLEVTSEFSKMYIKNNNVIFSFDENKSFTQILNIDLKTYDNHFKKIEKPLKKTPGNKKRNNTFIFEDNIYTISATKNIVALHAKNYSTDKEFKNHWALVTDSIYFKNSPIIQTGGAYDNYRELKGPNGTKKFLRKINSGNLGISIYKTEAKYIVTYGGVKEIKSGAAMMPFPGIPIASFGSIGIFVNPTAFAFSGYSSSRAVSIKALFDKNFNHLTGNIPKNAFDKIKEYQKEHNTEPKGNTVFKFKDKYILGYYNSWTRKYKLLRFD